MQVKFKFLFGDVNWLRYGGKWISTQKFNNGDFDYWLILELINMHEATGDEKQEKYHVNLQVVSLQEAGKENLDKALNYCGFNQFADEIKDDDLTKVDALSSYGISAQVWSKNGNNADKLIREAKSEAILVNGLFGFYLDRIQNRIQSTGWDFLRGDILAGLQENRQTA